MRPGDEGTLETRDGIDGRLTPGSTHADVLGLDLGLAHPLTGPLYVEGAARGRVAGQLPEAAIPPSARDGIRTIPRRETGGNLTSASSSPARSSYSRCTLVSALLPLGVLGAAAQSLSGTA